MLNAPSKLASYLLAIIISAASFAAPADETWSAVDKLLSEQKVQVALEKTTEILKASRKTKDTKTWTEALIRSVQYESGLHGYETSVRFLKDEAWPDNAESKVLLNLFYANLLMTYSGAYRWEIQQREKTVSADKPDLKAWTLLQIGDEIRKTFDAALAHDKVLANPSPKLFEGYLLPNTYPQSVRPTLRDAVTYMAAKHLGDTSFWTPEQSNEFYRLRPPALLKQAPGLTVADTKNHPMTIAASLLNQLNAYHVSASRSDAASEAKYEIFRQLHTAYSDAEDKIEVRKLLKAYQKDTSAKIWWPAGQALLADFYMGEPGAERMSLAQHEAKAGIDFAPESVAAKICVSIVKTIEYPRFQITAMQVDTLDRESVEVDHTNLKELYFRAYPYDLKARIKQVKGNRIDFENEGFEKFLRNQKFSEEWKVSLKDPGDFLSHRTFVKPPVKKQGSYIIAVSGKADFSDSNNATGYAYFAVSDFIIETKTPDGGAVEVRVRSGANGESVAGANVILYEYDWNTAPSEAETRVTGKDGTVQFTAAKFFSGNKQYFVAAEHKGQFLADLQTMWLYRAERDGMMRANLIFTDRAVYRPSQKIFWKISAYEGQATKGQYKSHASGEYEVVLKDPNYQDVAKKTVKTNAFGTASGEFLVPAGRPLGQWMIQSTPKGSAIGIRYNNGGSTGFRVEEYKRPTFEVTLKAPDENIRLNKPAKLDGEARYYFGSPVAGGKIAWSVTRTPVFPWWWYYWRSYDYESGGSRTQTVATGISKLKEDGTFTVQFTPEADERKNSKDVSYTFAVNADVTDEGGETRSADRSMRVGFVAVDANIIWENAFFKAGAPIEAKVNLHTLDGKPIKGKGSYKISRLAEPDRTFLPAELPPRKTSEGINDATPGDSKRARWETDWTWESVAFGWKAAAQVSEGQLTHSDKGDAAISLKEGVKEPGVYRITYETKDAFGTAYSMSRDFIVASAKAAGNFPLMALAETSSVKVGGTARFVVGSGLKDQPITIEYYRAGKMLKRAHHLSGKDGVLVEYPVTEEDRGGFSVQISAIRDYQSLRQELTVFVPWDNKDLKIEMATFRDKIRPGSKETFRVKVKGPDQKAAQAEILSYMYDRSLDLFGPHSPASYKSLYPYRSGVPGARLTLGQSQHHWWRNSWPSVPSRTDLRGDILDFID
ncbi:MAG: MG2 domain-containing protein, partial [Bdellovibrionia bacterium]